MKHSIIALALLAAVGSASAGQYDVLVTNTDEGGEIRLTIIPTGKPDCPRKAYIVAAGGRVTNGCWVADGNDIKAIWDFVGEYRYRISSFRKVEK